MTGSSPDEAGPESPEALGRSPRPQTDGSGRPNLAMRLRSMRAARNWTLEEASHHTGVSRSTLSKIENGAMSPTFDILYKISVGMNLDLVELFDTRQTAAPFGRRSVTRRGEGRLHETETYVHELIATDLAHKKLLPFRTRIKAREFEAFGDWIRHEGEEVLFVLSGSIKVFTEFYSPVVLMVGDSIYFDSKMGHAIISVSKKDAVVLWVCTGVPEVG
ncbi:helix-turn-helix domain-containing protein [Microvirga massiliensis]|uniref:helix-turn-helix domain-containing protein n=1 Tax=Microvirga massiliensis TaxID=1033741 RepID=UPI0009E3FF7A|nr:XRE family transcriptional regulator [Microvirga massiliensis]